MIRLATKDYNKLLNKNQSTQDEIARVQREKDLKVDTINKKYESELNILIRQKNEIDIILKNTKEYITKN